jgi:hypothetical protein
MSYLTAIGLLLLVMSPPLVPAAIGGIHAIINWRRHYERFLSALRARSRGFNPAV